MVPRVKREGGRIIRQITRLLHFRVLRHLSTMMNKDTFPSDREVINWLESCLALSPGPINRRDQKDKMLLDHPTWRVAEKV